MDRVRLEECADLTQGRRVVDVPPPVHGDTAARRPVEAEDHPHGRRLARPVGAEEAGDASGLDGEVNAVDGRGVAESLGQRGCLDHQATAAQRECEVMTSHCPGRSATTSGMAPDASLSEP
jgi:hypothetical protein